MLPQAIAMTPRRRSCSSARSWHWRRASPGSHRLQMPTAVHPRREGDNDLSRQGNDTGRRPGGRTTHRNPPAEDSARIYNNIPETIGHTPVVRLNRLAPPHVEMFVKIESFNPGGSVKDRLAFGIIDDAERRGLLRPGQTVVEATSGNTGIALAM